MSVDSKTKRLLIGAPPTCSHQGFLIPTVLVPLVMELPRRPQDPKPKKGFLGFFKDKPVPPVTFYRTHEALCLNCKSVLRFGPENPSSEQEANEPPAPVKVVEP